jgi:hypothetical protein
MNVPAALAHLKRANITRAVLRAEGVDPRSPRAVRAFVADRLAAIAAADCLYDGRIERALLSAADELLTAQERREREGLAARLRVDLEAMHHNDDVPACVRAA